MSPLLFVAERHGVILAREESRAAAAAAAAAAARVSRVDVRPATPEEAVDDEIHELDALERQVDAFPLPPAPPSNVASFPPQFRCVTGGAA